MAATSPINVLRSELPPARPVRLGEELGYAPGSIASRSIAKTPGVSMTLLAFDAGQEFSEHTASFDAFVQVLDGEVELSIAGEPLTVTAGETVLMPGGIPHAVRARRPFKMLLTMLRR
jgi:quercetin dioxygenase-like cupin family protein